MLDKCITDKQCILDIVNNFLRHTVILAEISRSNVTQLMLTKSLYYFEDTGFYPGIADLSEMLIDIENSV
jgi:hypothetical protein